MKICYYYEIDVYKLLENVENVNFSKTKFKQPFDATCAQNFTVNHVSPQIIKSIITNQTIITNLIQSQNELIDKLLK